MASIYKPGSKPSISTRCACGHPRAWHGGPDNQGHCKHRAAPSDCSCPAFTVGARLTKKPITLRFGVDFWSVGRALTSIVADVGYDGGVAATGCSCTHPEPDGWTIKGDVHEDYCLWVNDFEATHPELGYVRGNFENVVTASSRAAFDHFWKHHKPQAWDYDDI